MRLKEAEEIVERYVSAVEKATSTGDPVWVETWLPAPRQKIVHSLHLVAASIIEKDAFTEDVRRQLSSILWQLPYFVPARDAEKIRAHLHEFNEVVAREGSYEAERLYKQQGVVEVLRALNYAELARDKGHKLCSEFSYFIVCVQALNKSDESFHREVYSLAGIYYPAPPKRSPWDGFNLQEDHKAFLKELEDSKRVLLIKDANDPSAYYSRGWQLIIIAVVLGYASSFARGTVGAAFVRFGMPADSTPEALVCFALFICVAPPFAYWVFRTVFSLWGD